MGKLGGGKSTCVNALSGNHVIFQMDEGGCFIPNEHLSQIGFAIADNPLESKTKEVQVI